MPSYVVLTNFDDDEKPDCGTSWGIYDGDTPDEAAAKCIGTEGSKGTVEPFFVIEINPKKTWREGRSINTEPGEAQDFGLGYADNWQKRLGR